MKAKLLTSREAADYLGLTVAHVRRLLHSGSIPSVNVGDEKRPTYRVYKRELDAWLRRRKIAGHCSPEVRAWRLRSLEGGMQ